MPALLGLRQAPKISIYDYLPKCHQIKADLSLNCYDAILSIGSSSILEEGKVKTFYFESIDHEQVTHSY